MSSTRAVATIFSRPCPASVVSILLASAYGTVLAASPAGGQTTREVAPQVVRAVEAAPLPPVAEPNRGGPPSADEMAEEAREIAESMSELSQQMVDVIFSFSELGFQEIWTSDYVTGVLEREGFTVERGCAGMPTCYVATWGGGSPVIGFMGDIDGLPETSQKPGVAYRDPLIPGGPGHGEGHNSAAAVDVVGAISTKRVMEKYGLPGTLKVIPGVAEELVASRTYMVNAGLFDGMDAMLSTHISSRMSTSYGISGSGLVSTMFTFHGQSAHGAGSPWAGRSALDAAELMDVGWNFLREHLRLQQRSHSVIYNGGNQPNVVPSEATVWYYFRELDYDRIEELHEKGRRVAEGAAMMSDTEVTERMIGAAWPSNMNRVLAEVMHENIAEVGMPDWSEADQEMAKAAQSMMGQRDPRGLSTSVREELNESSQGNGGGSDDIAEVSWNVPTVRLRYAGAIPGMTAHHWSASIAAATPIAHKGANHGAQVIAMTAVDLLADPDRVEEAWEYHRDVTTAEREWVSLIPVDTEPATFLNAEKMERYRPLIEPIIYDPTRYDTYLEQLGIAYPTVREGTGSGAAADVAHQAALDTLPWPPVATFSILGYDPETGELGGAVQSRVFSVGNGVLWAEADVGVVATQAIVDVSYGPRGLELLRQAFAPEAVVRQLLEQDPDPNPERWSKEGRQFSVMASDGSVATHTGPAASEWAGHRVGQYVSAQGNILAGPEVVEEMVAAFESTEGHLAQRLVAALEAGQAAGGDRRGMQSAALVVVKKDAGVWLNNDVVLRLQVDDSDQPIAELRRLVEMGVRRIRR